MNAPQALCRDCGWMGAPSARCPACRSPRIFTHPDLAALSILHVDCDAFYAAVEKRDAPELVNRPVIIGGGRRGVVSTCCYVARTFGVRSAMPMFKALERCPEAVVIPPDIRKYVAVSRQIRAHMDALTPMVEPLSLDEAFLDLSGTERLHGKAPAAAAASLATQIERELGVTVSIGLGANKFLAKIASELDKPRGFAAIGAQEAPAFLADQPVSIIWGVGAATTARLERDGYRRVGDLARTEAATLIRRYGVLGGRLARLSRGEDARPVDPSDTPKSISAETTFDADVADPDLLLGHLWRLSERVSARLKARGLAGRTVTVKLKDARFQLTTRRRTLDGATHLADALYRAADPMLRRAVDGRTAWRLIGVGASHLTEAGDGAGSAVRDLLDPSAPRRAAAEAAMDALRARFGDAAIIKGRSLR